MAKAILPRKNQVITPRDVDLLLTAARKGDQEVLNTIRRFQSKFTPCMPLMHFKLPQSPKHRAV